MQRVAVESSDIVSVGYDPANRLLEVEFHGGRLYRYRDVDPDIHAQFMRADSFGTFFFAHINGRYRYEKVKNVQEQQTNRVLALVGADARDVHDAQVACEPYGIDLEPLTLPVDEVQADNAQDIAAKKAKQAYKLAGQPTVVCVSSWNILALHGFPGAYARAINGWLTAEELLQLMKDKADRTVCLTRVVAYYDGTRSKLFSQDHWGVLAGAPRGEGRPLDQLVIMNGQDQTLAELQDKTLATWIAPEESAWHEFATWLRLQRRLGKV